MSLSIGDIIKLIQTGVQVFRDLRSLYDASRKDVERQEKGDRWATYINPIHSLKISWPSQRWKFTEKSNITADISYPLFLEFKMTEPVAVPSPRGSGINDEVVPNIAVLIDRNGGIPMDIYLKTTTESYSSLYKAAGAKFIEERSGRKVESDEAVVPFHAVYPNVDLWQILKIKRFEDKMYTVRGLVIENPSVSAFDIAFNDLPKIMNSIAVLRSKD